MLSPKTLRFIKDLTQNNNRDWFQENRKRYEAAKEDFTNLAGRLILEVGQFE